MGGRMSGESPREEKLVVRNCRAGAVRPCQIRAAGDAVTPSRAMVRQASRQQLAACKPLGQHGF
jgi:hypothetical protein